MVTHPFPVKAATAPATQSTTSPRPPVVAAKAHHSVNVKPAQPVVSTVSTTTTVASYSLKSVSFDLVTGTAMVVVQLLDPSGLVVRTESFRLVQAELDAVFASTASGTIGSAVTGAIAAAIVQHYNLSNTTTVSV